MTTCTLFFVCNTLDLALFSKIISEFQNPSVVKYDAQSRESTIGETNIKEDMTKKKTNQKTLKQSENSTT